MLVVLALAHLMVQQGEAVNCGQVNSNLAPCVTYLTTGGVPPEACCKGVENIKAITQTTADRQQACECFKAAGNRFPNVKEDAATTLPGKCGIASNIPISKSINCQNIN
ncbi:non-specific lipid-transfer protein A-like [Prunus yedoensis var. nudiflora]|uniref:Non-specific lipid-transfer protein n=1 Tax=Prunus yedoensis var. nudiflora TaxID=2094558 RepID=A0A314UUG2_PRUYE|nr:non-specific lipid-transfer protein A-like [Prunus yedoensis var. nudiflora]